ncbi:MAG: 3-oxoacyl-[acyl-carrier-protein] reductase [Clostridia bacterium]|nr:3-oxoacyl-[acyl-carrier-protein] reductase [Clostridia bacterium]
MTDKRVALVTGASRGIGKAIAFRLAQEGIYVVLNCSAHAEAAEAAAEEIRQAGGEAEVVSFSVDDEAQVKAAVDGILTRLGRIDILVNNAGITRDGLLMMMKPADFEAVMKVNLFGTFYCTKAVIRQMVKRRTGRIVNISSISGIMGNAGQANYSASKAGIIGFTKAVAREMAGRNITVNAVAPGFIDTDMTKAMSADLREKAAAQIPVGHFGTPEDVARAVSFLVSEESGYITGQVLAVDGGMSM